MYDKIYKNLRFISMLALILTAGATLTICYTVLTKTLFFRVLAAVLLIAGLIYVLTVVISLRLTENIVKPIEKEYSFDNDDYEGVYEEIQPFLRRIARQNHEIQQQMDEIKEQMRLKENAQQIRQEFTANVSHELKTPLTTIHGYAQIISAGIAKPEDVQSFASKIEKESSRLMVLIDDIIELSHLDENIQPMDKGEISLMMVAKDVTDTLQIHAGEKNVKMRIEGEDLNVNGSLSQITELVYNLCDNAIKYNRDGGSVTIRITPGNGEIDAGNGSSGCGKQQGSKHYIGSLSVTDTGIGIPAEHLDRIFERFFRVDKSRSQKVKGTGLGLSIVKHLAQLNNASIEVKSTEGVGTTFTVYFADEENL